MKVVNIVLGVLSLLLGILCMFGPFRTFLSSAWILGTILLIAGINILILHSRKKDREIMDILAAIIMILAGLILLVSDASALFTDEVLIYITGIALIVIGIIEITQAVSAKKNGDHSWGWPLAGGILMILGGIVSLTHPLITAFAIGYFIAFSLFSQGINMLALGLKSDN